ncbi:glycosyltransferase [Flavobacterium sp. FZUC8N2.13]|uniref:Glycosyltransferase n=1 Tax=Flavobacterium zubiriense TaxID=3138075 RepID=A0ABV4T7G3_9FLAO
MSNTMVTVVMITYGHEKFIKQAIKGVLEQKVNFQVELIIANDCSPDKTAEEIDAILQTETIPSNINIVNKEHKKNIGMMPNFIWALKQAKGKYIALCEGDDYWTEPTKLQRQVDFMEQHSNYIMCCHDRNVVNENDEVLIQNQQTTKADKDTFVQTLLYRNISFDDTFYHYFEKAKNGDTFLIYRLHQLGATHYFDFNGACYRVSDVGVWSKVSDDKRFEMSISSLDNMIEYYSFLANKGAIKEIKKWKAEQFLMRSKSLSEAGYKTSALNHIFRYNTLLLSSNPNHFFSLNNFKTIILLNLRYLLR